MAKKQPIHPGEILEEDCIIFFNLNLGKLAERLSISRKTLYKARTEAAAITVAFDTVPQRSADH